MLTIAVAVFGLLACGQTDTVIVDVSGDPDTLVVAGSVGTGNADTLIGPPDTVIITSLDTVFAPVDTVVISTVDTVVAIDTVVVNTVDTIISGIDTTFVSVVDTVFSLDTLVVATFDTVFTFDTVIVLRVDTLVTVDTVIVVDTVNVSTTLVASVSQLNIDVGQTAMLSVTTQNPLGFPSVPTSVTWLSNAPAVASVSTTGVVLGVSSGQATIFALASGLSASVPTTVTSPFTPITGASPVFQDNFDTGTRAAAQSGYSWSSPGGQLPPVVSNARAFSGTHSLRFGYGPDAATAGDDSSSEQRFVLGAYLSEAWFEYMLYVPANFYHRKVPGDTHNNKFFVLWRDTYSGSSDWLVDVEFEAQFDPRNDGTSRIRPTTGTGIVYNIPSPQLTTANFINNGVTPVTGAWAITPGNWTRIRIHVKMSTGVGTNDGVLEMWANSTLFFAKTNGNFIGTTGVRDFRNGYLMGYANSGFNNLTEFFIDDFKIYNANPLW